MTEQWRQVIGADCGYEVSNFGNVRHAGKPMKASHCSRNLRYAVVVFRLNKTAVRIYVHTAVCEAFICKRPYKMEVNHKDGNTLNNRLENLEWVSPKENRLHAYRNSARMEKYRELAPKAIKMFREDKIRQCDIAKELGIGEFVVYCLIHSRHESLK